MAKRPRRIRTPAQTKVDVANRRAKAVGVTSAEDNLKPGTEEFDDNADLNIVRRAVYHRTDFMFALSAHNGEDYSYLPDLANYRPIELTRTIREQPVNGITEVELDALFNGRMDELVDVYRNQSRVSPAFNHEPSFVYEHTLYFLTSAQFENESPSFDYQDISTMRSVPIRTSYNVHTRIRAMAIIRNMPRKDNW